MKHSDVASAEDWLPPVDTQCRVGDPTGYSTEKSCITTSVEHLSVQLCCAPRIPALPAPPGPHHQLLEWLPFTSIVSNPRKGLRLDFHPPSPRIIQRRSDLHIRQQSFGGLDCRFQSADSMHDGHNSPFSSYLEGISSVILWSQREPPMKKKKTTIVDYRNGRRGPKQRAHDIFWGHRINMSRTMSIT